MPIINEPIETLNSRLVDHFGIDVVTGDAIYRIVFSEDQVEKRLTKYTPEGLELLSPVVRELPKYKQWIHNKYILEKLVMIPEGTCKELTVNQASYEPLFVFEDLSGEALPPHWDVCKLVVDSVNFAMGKSSAHGLARYIDSEIEPEKKEERLQELEKALFGNETEVGDALAHGQAIVVPSNYKVN